MSPFQVHFLIGKRLTNVVNQFLTRHIILPMLDLLRGQRTLKYYREFCANQKLTRKEIRATQERRFRSLVDDAVRNVPYYKKHKTDTMRDISNLERWPVLTRKAIVDNLDAMRSRKPGINTTESKTGGSTGEPLRFHADMGHPGYATANLWRTFSWGGWKPGMRHTNLWGAWTDRMGQTSKKAKIRNGLENVQFLDATNLSEESLKKYAKDLKEFKPVLLRGYAQAIYLMAEYVNQNDIEGINPTCIATSGEQLMQWQRPVIKEAFGAEPMDSYGCRECSVIAAECPEHEGYHISDETGIVEFVDDNDEPVAEGELGRMLITDLTNHAMPFIRYEVGDLGRPTDHRCSCGRTLSLFKSVEGRITDFIVTPDNRFILGTGMSQTFWEMENVDRAILFQEKVSELIIKVIPNEGYSEEDTKLIEKKVRNFVGEDMKVHVKLVSEIPMGRSGKRRSAISKVNVRF